MDPFDLPESEDSSSEDEVCKSLEPSDEEGHLVAKLCREGGVFALSHFLISKAISPIAEETSPKEWMYRDILQLPKEHLEEWRQACMRELDTLNR